MFSSAFAVLCLQTPYDKVESLITFVGACTYLFLSPLVSTGELTMMKFDGHNSDHFLYQYPSFNVKVNFGNSYILSQLCAKGSMWFQLTLLSFHIVRVPVNRKILWTICELSNRQNDSIALCASTVRWEFVQQIRLVRWSRVRFPIRISGQFLLYAFPAAFLKLLDLWSTLGIWDRPLIWYMASK